MTNLSSFDLNLLKVLQALLQEHSTVRAGQKVGLSQPAVSAALARLRAALGDELFFRQGQGLAPTDFARALADPLARILSEAEALLQADTRFDPARDAARFRISGSDFFAEMLMPRLAERFGRIAPHSLVHLVDLVPDSHVDTLERYDVDLALIPRTTHPSWIESTLAFRSTFAVVARQDHPRLAHAGLRPGDVIPIDLFCDLGHALFSPEGKSAGLGDAALAEVGRKRQVVMTLPVFSGIYRAVAGSDLIALLPHSLALQVAADVGLAVYQPPMPVPLVDLMMVWHRRYTAQPAHRWLRAQLAELLAPLDDPAPFGPHYDQQSPEPNTR